MTDGPWATVHNIRRESMREGDVYIGRRGHGQDGYFGNPYMHLSRDENIAMFRTYFYDRIAKDAEFKERVAALAGRRLFCFCKPQACHGDVIATYLNFRRQP